MKMSTKFTTNHLQMYCLVLLSLPKTAWVHAFISPPSCFLTLTQLHLSILPDDLLLRGMGPGNVGGRALPILIFDMLVSRGWSNGCIGNALPMDRGTMCLCHGFPTTLVRRGIRRWRLCILGVQGGNDPIIRAPNGFISQNVGVDAGCLH